MLLDHILENYTDNQLFTHLLEFSINNELKFKTHSDDNGNVDLVMLTHFSDNKHIDNNIDKKKCNGLIIDINNRKIISKVLPCPKEIKTPFPSYYEGKEEEYTAYDILGGSIVSLYYFKGWKLSSKNSFDLSSDTIYSSSSFWEIFMELFNMPLDVLNKDEYYNFLIIHPKLHLLNYKRIYLISPSSSLPFPPLLATQEAKEGKGMLDLGKIYISNNDDHKVINNLIYKTKYLRELEKHAYNKIKFNDENNIYVAALNIFMNNSCLINALSKMKYLQKQYGFFNVYIYNLVGKIYNQLQGNYISSGFIKEIADIIYRYACGNVFSARKKINKSIIKFTLLQPDFINIILDDYITFCKNVSRLKNKNIRYINYMSNNDLTFFKTYKPIGKVLRPSFPCTQGKEGMYEILLNIDDNYIKIISEISNEKKIDENKLYIIEYEKYENNILSIKLESLIGNI